MAFDSGTRLGAFQILAPLGAGGMGEVYSALDTRLDRQVALKMVRDELVADPEHGLRFEHEARTLASLSHPNIAVLHGFEQVEGRHFLVMELAKGETLADRIARYPGGLPVDDAVKIARQIAEALEAAHEKGIVHRDLKPGNVKVGSDDTVKVLDFGLAKAIGPAAAIAPDGMDSPTVAAPATGVGVLLGTAAYLAPEQARGKAVDRRADIWAFGAVLFEMLSGSRLFKGDTPSDIVAAVLTREPELDRLPPGVPASLHLLLRRCLEHDPRRRLRDIGEARIMLEQPVLQASPAPTADARATGASPLRWVALALAVGAAAALAAWQLRPVPYQPVIQYEIPAPAGASLELSARPAVAVSPDGSMLAMVVSAEGEARLYLRNRGDVELREVPGTSGASDPAFSPDGRWIAFVTPAELVKVSVDGGTRVALAPVQDPRGIAWLDNETIVAALSVETGLSAVPAGGGPLRDLTAPDRGRGERTHRWPAPVPGGGAVLFTVGTVANPDDYNDAPVDAVVVATGERRRVLEAATMARVTADRRLLFSRHGVLHAAGFDPTRLQLTAPPRPVLPAVEGDATTGAGHFSISTEGTLAYVPGRSAIGQRHLAWADRSGALSPINLAPAVFNQPAVSPDGRRVAVIVGTLGRADAWIYEVDRQLFSRFTFDGLAAAPVWSADGESLYYTNIDPLAQESTLMRKRVDGNQQATALAKMPGRAYAGHVDHDERSAIVMSTSTGSGMEIVRLPLAPAGPPQTIVERNALQPTVSPDGRWLAYVADASGVQEVWVRELDGTGQWQISTLGGVGPRWSPDGRELYFRRADVQMAVAIETTPRFRAGQERALFPGAFNWRTEGGLNYAVDPATGRFLMIVPASGEWAQPAVRVIANWEPNRN